MEIDQKTRTFVEKAQKIHGDKYDYSLVIYVTSKQKIKIICTVHGVFEQSPEVHLRGSNCNACSYQNRGRKTAEQFCIEAEKIHNGKYTYGKVIYNGDKLNVIITCPCHGDFEQTPGCHLSGSGCSKCAGKYKWTTEEYIEEAKKVHFDTEYDYSKTDYVNSGEKIKIICPMHGEFLQNPSSHLQGHGCSGCVNLYRRSAHEFIEKSNEIHDGIYDYSRIDYKNMSVKVGIICQRHGIFFQAPSRHLLGEGCMKCGTERRAKFRTKTTNKFIEDASKIHGNLYDYSKVCYKNNIEKVEIGCETHGIFLQSPMDHLAGCGCLKCASEKWASKKRHTKESFSEKSNEIHKGKYDYSETRYGKNNREKVVIKCRIHGNFTQLSKHHMGGRGCPKCANAGFSKMACGWLDEIARTRNIIIEHALNSGEKRISIPTGKTVNLDGFCKETNTVFEFHGCIWHGCLYCFQRSFENPKNKKTMKDLYKQTKLREESITALGYNLEVIWECEYNGKRTEESVALVEVENGEKEENTERVNIISQQAVFSDFVRNKLVLKTSLKIQSGAYYNVSNKKCHAKTKTTVKKYVFYCNEQKDIRICGEKDAKELREALEKLSLEGIGMMEVK